MAYHVQYRDHNRKWKVSGFARSFPTSDDAWRYAASLDQDALILPDIRVVDSTGNVLPRPESGAYQSELLGL